MSTGANITDTDDGNVFTRIWAGWNRFWFSPADPTPLCFMRIVAGILTLYVHIAYCFDLEDFFGPRGWYDQKVANEYRTSFPHALPHTAWDAQDRQQFFMPPDPSLRAAVKTFVANILERPQFSRTLDFMESLRTFGDERNEVLRYLRTLPTDPALRDTVLRPFLEGKLAPEAMDVLPKFFQRQSTPESRQAFISEFIAFSEALPRDDRQRELVLGLLLTTEPGGWEALQNFVRELSLIPPKERDAELEFQAVWSVPTSKVYAKGMPVYSPWFHVSDVRVLWLIHGIHLFAILMFTLGMYTRVTSVMTWIACLSYVNRAQPYLFGQDTMMNLAVFYLMMSPCNAKWSLDRYMARKQAEARGEKLPPVQPTVWAGFMLRVFQIQYSLMYLSAGLSKLKGTSWWNGTALFNCLANAEFAPMHVKLYRDFMVWLCSNENRVIWEFVMSGSAAFTMLTELPFPWAIWTRARPILVAMAILLHTGIAILMGLSVFSLFMFTLLLCYMPADAINWMFEPSEK